MTDHENQVISRAIGGNLTASDILAYEAELLSETKKRVVKHWYVEEAKELLPAELEALIYLNDIKTLEVKTQLKSIVKLTRLYEAYQQQMYIAAGFTTIEEWLDSYGLNGRSGTLSQLLAIAKQIIPWCKSNRIIVNGQPINLDWFKRIVDSKCVAGRACLIVSLFRRTIASGAPIDTQKEIIKRALAAVENPAYSQRYLIDTFAGYGSKSQMSGTSYKNENGQTTFVIETNGAAQEQWLQQRLGSTTQFNKLAKAFYFDDGLTWLNRDALMDYAWLDT